MIRIVDAQTVNGVISIVVERRHWYWPWLRRCEYIAEDKRYRYVYDILADLLGEVSEDLWGANYDWMSPKTGASVTDALAWKLTRAYKNFSQREKMLRRLEQGYDNVISIDDGKRKGA
jgi:hypothetical protein